MSNDDAEVRLSLACARRGLVKLMCVPCGKTYLVQLKLFEAKCAWLKKYVPRQMFFGELATWAKRRQLVRVDLGAGASGFVQKRHYKRKAYSIVRRNRRVATGDFNEAMAAWARKHVIKPLY